MKDQPKPKGRLIIDIYEDKRFHVYNEGEIEYPIEYLERAKALIIAQDQINAASVKQKPKIVTPDIILPGNLKAGKG